MAGAILGARYADSNTPIHAHERKTQDGMFIMMHWLKVFITARPSSAKGHTCHAMWLVYKVAVSRTSMRHGEGYALQASDNPKQRLRPP